MMTRGYISGCYVTDISALLYIRENVKDVRRRLLMAFCLLAASTGFASGCLTGEASPSMRIGTPRAVLTIDDVELEMADRGTTGDTIQIESISGFWQDGFAEFKCRVVGQDASGVDIVGSDCALLFGASESLGLKGQTNRIPHAIAPIAMRLTGEARKDILAVATGLDESDYDRHFGYSLFDDIRGWTQRVAMLGMEDFFTLSPGEPTCLRLGFRTNKMQDGQLLLVFRVRETGRMIRDRLVFRCARWSGREYVRLGSPR